MQTRSMTQVERLQYEQGIDASNLGLANFYTDMQEKHGEAIDAMFTQSQDDWKQFLAENTGDVRKASGQLGRSTDRISAIELGAYFKKGHDQVQSLIKANHALQKEGAKARGQARSQQMQMFANNAFMKFPDMAPPKPALQNVGAAAFKEALGIFTSVGAVAAPLIAASSEKLKDNIIKVGESIEGHNIYKFNYKGDSRKYIGVIAEEVKKVKPEAVSRLSNGYLGVNYNLIDVDFKEVAV